MIVISGALVVVALVLLVIGLAGGGLTLVYASIGVSLLSFVFLVFGILQRRKEAPAAETAAAPAAVPAAAPGPVEEATVTTVRPALPRRRLPVPHRQGRRLDRRHRGARAGLHRLRRLQARRHLDRRARAGRGGR